MRKYMSGEMRRDEIVNILRKTKEPITGSNIAKLLGVSRQIIVQDVALLRARGFSIIATTKGYLYIQ